MLAIGGGVACGSSLLKGQRVFRRRLNDQAGLQIACMPEPHVVLAELVMHATLNSITEYSQFIVAQTRACLADHTDRWTFLLFV